MQIEINGDGITHPPEVGPHVIIALGDELAMLNIVMSNEYLQCNAKGKGEANL